MFFKFLAFPRFSLELVRVSADLDEPQYFSVLLTLRVLLIISSWYPRILE